MLVLLSLAFYAGLAWMGTLIGQDPAHVFVATFMATALTIAISRKFKETHILLIGNIVILAPALWIGGWGGVGYSVGILLVSDNIKPR